MSSDNVMDMKRHPSRKPVEVQLIESNVQTRWTCHVCSGHTDKYTVLAEVQGGEYDGFRVCDRCIRNRDFDDKLQERAASLEAQAAKLRSLSGRLSVPSFRDWEMALLKDTAAFVLKEHPDNAAIRASELLDCPETLTREEVAAAFEVTVADAERASWRYWAERLKAEKESCPADDFDDDLPF